jgi:hypothetical protein
LPPFAGPWLRWPPYAYRSYLQRHGYCRQMPPHALSCRVLVHRIGKK